MLLMELTSAVMKGVLMLMLVLTGFVWAEEREFRPRQVVEPFEEIRDPKTVGVDEAGRFVKDEELVLGVVVKGEARAYPINMLTSPRREIINDKLGGQAIAATW